MGAQQSRDWDSESDGEIVEETGGRRRANVTCGTCDTRWRALLISVRVFLVAVDVLCVRTTAAK